MSPHDFDASGDPNFQSPAENAFTPKRGLARDIPLITPTVMSWPSSSRPPTATTPSKRLFVQDGRRENNWSWNSRRVNLPGSSSSPPRSSSPPSTPSSNRHSYGYAYIRSSPEIGPDSSFRGSSEHLEDPVFPWDRRHSSYGAIRPTSSSYTAVSLKPTLPHPMDRLPSSDFEPSDYSEDFDHDPLDLDSEHTSDSAPPSSTPFSDSEEDDSPTQDDSGFEFNLSPCRRTFFRTSAERGQWKSDPFALKPGSAPSTWPTAPTLSRVPTPTVPASSRISIASLLQPEPACPLSQLSKPTQQPQPTASSSLLRADTSECEVVVPTPSESQVELSTASPHTVPSLTSDRESSPDVEDDHASPLSPLPPSSPPLSPVSVALSYHSDPLDLSCLSSPMSSPVLRSSSPLSELSLDEDDETTHQAKFTLENQLGALDDSDDLTRMDTDDNADSGLSKPTMSRSAQVEANGRMTSSNSYLNQRKTEDPSRGPSNSTSHHHQEKTAFSLLPSVSERKAEVITDVSSGPCEASISERARDGQASRPVEATAGLGPGPAGLSTAASASASKSIISHSSSDSTTRTTQIPISSLLSPTPLPTSSSSSSAIHQQWRQRASSSSSSSPASSLAKPETRTEAESQCQTLSDGDGVPDRKTSKSKSRHEAVGSASLKKLLIDDGALDDADGAVDCQRNGEGMGMEMEIAVGTLARDVGLISSSVATTTGTKSEKVEEEGSGVAPCLAEDGDGDVVMVDGAGEGSDSVEGAVTSGPAATSAFGVGSMTGTTPAPSTSEVQVQVQSRTKSQGQLRDKNGVERVAGKKAAASSSGVVEDSEMVSVSVSAAVPRKSDASSSSAGSGSGKRKETSEEGGAPVKKRRKVGPSAVGDAVASSSSSSRQVKEEKEGENELPMQKKQKKPRKKRSVEESVSAGPSNEEGGAASTSKSTLDDATPSVEETTTTKPKKGGKRGRRAVAPPVAEQESDVEDATTTTTSSTHPSSSSSSSSGDAPLDAATAAMHAEVCGLLIETLALSRASSMPVSLIVKTLMRNHPTLEGQRSEKEWMGVVRRVLRDGEAGRGSGVFGKVESSGKDDADRPLEAHWFYVPELDTDQDRATLIKSMMPRPAKRSTTKKYKQYYWRPLDKISKWDPEDEL